MTTIFQCTPVHYYWDGWDEGHEGKCLSLNGLVWANAAVSISLDFWMLALPLSQIRHMSLRWRKKVEVSLMFAVGML
jgi:rhodopsin domain-containing protein